MDSLDFILKCKQYEIPIYRIEIVQIDDSKTVSSLDRIMDCSSQEKVYSAVTRFIQSQMDNDWNYATFVTG